jgi:hypothetical protein
MLISNRSASLIPSNRSPATLTQGPKVFFFYFLVGVVCEGFYATLEPIYLLFFHFVARSVTSDLRQYSFVPVRLPFNAVLPLCE